MAGPPVPPQIAARAKQLRLDAPDCPIVLFRFDASKLFSFQTGLPGPTYYFHNMNLQSFTVLPFQGNDYMPTPITDEGWEWTTDGKLPRPKLTIGNLGVAPYLVGPISSLLYLYDSFRNATLERKMTMYKYLDNQPGADATKEWPPEVWRVESIDAEMRESVAFELAAPFDNEGVRIPRHQILANACRFPYRGSPGCTYSRAPLTDEFGNSLWGTPDSSGSNLVIDAAVNTKVGSATHNFVSGDVNKILKITGAAGWIGGYYKVVSVASNKATLDKSPGTVNTTGGGWALGGLRDRGAWDSGTTYPAKDYVYTVVNGVQEVFVATAGAAAGHHPRYFPAEWKKDVCRKDVPACGLRFSPDPLRGAFWPAVARAPIGST